METAECEGGLAPKLLIFSWTGKIHLNSANSFPNKVSKIILNILYSRMKLCMFVHSTLACMQIGHHLVESWSCIAILIPFLWHKLIHCWNNSKVSTASVTEAVLWSFVDLAGSRNLTGNPYSGWRRRDTPIQCFDSGTSFGHKLAYCYLKLAFQSHTFNL